MEVVIVGSRVKGREEVPVVERERRVSRGGVKVKGRLKVRRRWV